jgi:pSer/pThr/pTyr-binding forkhead associated (FHA) protein
MKIRLQVAIPQGQPFAFEHPGPTCHVGRDPAAELALHNAESVSWRHARIDLGKDGAWITDLGSSNGTFVNGKRLDRRGPLKAGDQVQLGQTGPRLAVTELDTGGRAPAPAVAPKPAAVPRVKPAAAGRAPANNLVLAACGLCLGLALVLAFVAWRQGAQLGGLQREVAELSSKVEEMSRNKHLELSRQIAELSEKMTQEGGDKSGEFNKQLNELTNTITRAIEQARQAPTLPEKPPDSPPPAEGEKPTPDVPKPADKPSTRLVSLGTVADTPAAGPPLLLQRAEDRAPWKLLPASGKVESGRPLAQPARVPGAAPPRRRG